MQSKKMGFVTDIDVFKYLITTKSDFVRVLVDFERHERDEDDRNEYLDYLSVKIHLYATIADRLESLIIPVDCFWHTPNTYENFLSGNNNWLRNMIAEHDKLTFLQDNDCYAFNAGYYLKGEDGFAETVANDVFLYSIIVAYNSFVSMFEYEPFSMKSKLYEKSSDQ